MLILILPPRELMKSDTKSIAISPTISIVSQETKKEPVSINKTSQGAISASVSELKRFALAKATEYGISFDLMDKILICESNYQTAVWSSNMSSFGVAQYTRVTFRENCEGKYEDPYAQLECMAKMISRGLIGRWDCAKILGLN